MNERLLNPDYRDMVECLKDIADALEKLKARTSFAPIASGLKATARASSSPPPRASASPTPPSATKTASGVLRLRRKRKWDSVVTAMIPNL